MLVNTSYQAAESNISWAGDTALIFLVPGEGLVSFQVAQDWSVGFTPGKDFKI